MLHYFALPYLVEMRRHPGDQFLGVLVDFRVHVDVGGVPQQIDLLGEGRHGLAAITTHPCQQTHQ